MAAGESSRRLGGVPAPWHPWPGRYVEARQAVLGSALEPPGKGHGQFTDGYVGSSRAPASHVVTQRFIGGPPRGSRDDLIRPGKERLRNRESEGLRGLEVDDQLELCWLRYREIGGLGAFQDLADVHSGTTEHVRYARPVG